MKKRRVLKNWVVEILGTIIASWLVFVSTTIENIGNTTYHKVLIGWTILAIISLYLIKKYSKVLED